MKATTKIYIGIDLHKVKQTWVGIPEQGEGKLFSKEFPVTPDGVKEAISFAKKYGGTLVAVLEPCCGWKWVKKQLEESGLEVHMTNPRKVRAIADSLQKTDENDAHTLALLLRTGLIHESRDIPEDIQKLRSLVRERSFFVRLRTTVKCRLEGIVTREGRHLVEGSLSSKKGTTIILASEYSEWKDHVLSIKEIDTHVQELEKEMTKKAKAIPTCILLQTVPGIGVISALTIYTEVGDFSTFKRPEQLAAFSGLVPTERSSGGVQKLGHITHAGSRHLRYILVEAAMHIHNTEGSEVLYAFYKKIKDRSGAMRARTALARKILTICWYMVTRDEPYQQRILPC